MTTHLEAIRQQLEGLLILPGEITWRELEVLDCVMRGMGNEQIAHELKLSRLTVTHHLTAAYRHLGVYNRTGAVVACIKAGLLNLNGGIACSQRELAERRAFTSLGKSQPSPSR